MRTGSCKLAVALVIGLGLVVSCGGGGGGKSSPFPKEVRDVFGDFEQALRDGNPDLPPTITCGATISNPFDANGGTSIDQIAGQDNHSGTVNSATSTELEIRDTNGSGAIVFSIVDSSDPGRLFYQFVGAWKKPAIKFVPPPLGANEFLAADGTGQVFVIVTIERAISWQSTFENDPVGTTGTGTLVDFFGPPVIPVMPDGTISGLFKEKTSYLVEFSVTAGVPNNTACIVGIDQIGEWEANWRVGSGMSVTPLSHFHDAFADTAVGPVNALSNKHAIVAPVGTDALPLNSVANDDMLHLTNGRLLGGIKNFPSLLIENTIDDANGAVTLVSDGVGDPVDGDFGGVSTYNIDGTLTVTSGPGGLNNGFVEVSVLTIETDQEEDPAFDNFDHPVLDEFWLYGEVFAESETGLIIYR